jgi:hypothetical protein
LHNRIEGEELVKEVEQMGAALQTTIKIARQLSVDPSPPILEGGGYRPAGGGVRYQRRYPDHDYRTGRGNLTIWAR